ncbi:hypothetical protein BU14_0326s0011 [Porphyra umbilicalis]|uniref:RING-type domain-containing protein n=1 Tax=Porphyra umbilicalis TaxID=2786 RepID=A0A1X6NZ11_PORUM|nr:hypothetical protein BU14_0326s0011 [Porphyra umbilicalis]|eukprot:OSX73817.1 hypothetical protein BU14_0326s0011 [Porphyra umbilicalis]
MARNRGGRGGGRTAGGGAGGGSSGGGRGSGGGGGPTARSPPHHPSSSLPVLSSSPDVPADALCLVCASEAGDWAIASPCGHAVCGDCSHRLRVLYGETACVLCKTVLADVLVVPAGYYTPSSGLPPPAGLAATATLDAAVHMRFVDGARREELAARRAHTCPACGFGDELPDPAAPKVIPGLETADTDRATRAGKTRRQLGAPMWTTGTRVVNPGGCFSSLGGLRSHVRAAHNSVFCDVCVAHRKAYDCEQVLYPLDGDNAGGGSSRGRSAHSSKCRAHAVSSHPMCEFCHRRLYDEDALFAHLTRDHYSCFLCERAGRYHEYYRNYASLEAHYGEEHYMCAEEGCRGVVFAAPVDLRLHQHQVHGGGWGRRAERAERVGAEECAGAACGSICRSCRLGVGGRQLVGALAVGKLGGAEWDGADRATRSANGSGAALRSPMSSFLMVGVAAVVAEESGPGGVEALGVPSTAVVVAAVVVAAVTATGP